MKILVIGLDGAAPELLLGDDRLSTIRSLMEAGCYGRLESVVPSTNVPGWMCLSTGQDPGSLGVYGLRDRADHSYKGLGVVDSRSITAPAIWDQVAGEGGKSILIGVPPGYPPRKVNGISVGCFLTPDTSTGDYTYTHPPEAAATIARLVGDYPVSVKDFLTDDKARMRDEILEMSRKQFTVVRHFLENEPWDYFHFVEVGLDHIQSDFWQYHDPEHVFHEPDGPFADVVREYYLHLDEQIASILELLTEDTVVLVVSGHGARRLDGFFCVNEWLAHEGLLTLRSYPEVVTPFAKLDVDWSKTTAWSLSGSSCSRVFLNVKGREPEGTIDPADYERVRDEIKARLEATTDAEGRPLGALVFKPEEIYREVRNVAPDLIVHLGGQAWRPNGGVGYPTVHVPNDSGRFGCNHAQHGAFVLASPHLSPIGEIEGAHLLDIAPTLLELGGYPPLPDAHGKSLVAGRGGGSGDGAGDAIDDDELVRERLRGLGYIG